MSIYFLKKYATDQGTTDSDAAILFYIRPVHMSSQQYANDLVTEECMIAKVNDEVSMKDVFFEYVFTSIRHKLYQYCTENPQTGLKDIKF